jgi:hypothetical protein
MEGEEYDYSEITSARPKKYRNGPYSGFDYNI